MCDPDALEDLAPAADLRPLGVPVRGGRGRAVRAVVPGLVLVAVSAGAASLVARLVPAVPPLLAAVLIGAVLANLGLVPAWARPGTHLAARRLLRVGVVLLGFQLPLGEVARLGGPGLAVVVAVVVSTFLGTRWLGARLGVSPALSLLVATGFAICGASAVAAVEGVADADEEEVAAAVALVTLCGSLAMVVLPLVGGPLMGLHGADFGAWAGASVHDVAQVVATASTAGPASLHTAVVVKLTRVALLAPLIAGLTVARRRARPSGADVGLPPAARPPLVPLFVVGFLAAVALRSTAIVPSGWLATMGVVQTAALAGALVGLGTGVRLARLRRLGGRPLVLALLSWLLIATVAYAGVRLVGA